MNNSAPLSPPGIDLAFARTFHIKDRGTLYTFTFAPITPAQWRAYFSAILTTSEQQGKEIIRTTDTGAAKLALFQSALVVATGYHMPEGVNSCDVQSYRGLIPSAHQLALGDLLVATNRVSPAKQEGDEEGDAVVISLGEERVEIETIWTNINGVNRKVGPLVHYFETPTPDQQRRYSRDSSRSKIEGGSRRGKTIWMGAQMTLAKLYDELVTRVEGYTFDGAALTSREAIAAHMDTYHKVVAANQIFSAAEVDSE